MKSQFNQKLIKHLQHLLHIDPERVKYLLLEIDYHHLLKQPEVKVLFDGTELTVQHIESRTAAYQKLQRIEGRPKRTRSNFFTTFNDQSNPLSITRLQRRKYELPVCTKYKYIQYWDNN